MKTILARQCKNVQVVCKNLQSTTCKLRILDNRCFTANILQESNLSCKNGQVKIIARREFLQDPNIFSHVENTCKVKLLCKTIKLARQCSDVAKYDLQVKNAQVKIIAREFLQDPKYYIYRHVENTCKKVKLFCKTIKRNLQDNAQMLQSRLATEESWTIGYSQPKKYW